MGISIIDPVADPRWRIFVESHPAAGIFHSPGWLEALCRTYGYQPLAYVDAAPDSTLLCGIPFCSIDSVLTGRRLVSLPFSDHCQPLISDSHQFGDLMAAVKDDVHRRRLKYAEIRPLSDGAPAEVDHLRGSSTAVIHRVNLAGGLDQLFARFHKDCIVRTIRKAERRSGELRYEAGRSDALIAAFYRLLLLTRRKHHIPPQPISWFQNLGKCLQDRMCIRLLSKDDHPVAATLSLSFKNVVTYKYSCSDPDFNYFNGTVLLIWRTIQDAVANGATELDLGRSDLDNPGLICFKDRWGAKQAALAYYRYPQNSGMTLGSLSTARAARLVISKIPDSIFTAVGGVFYRHVG